MRKSRPHKGRERSEDYAKAVFRQALNDYTTNNIEDYNFRKLVTAGVLVEEPQNGVCEARR